MSSLERGDEYYKAAIKYCEVKRQQRGLTQAALIDKLKVPLSVRQYARYLSGEIIILPGTLEALLEALGTNREEMKEYLEKEELLPATSRAYIVKCTGSGPTELEEAFKGHSASSEVLHHDSRSSDQPERGRYLFSENKTDKLSFLPLKSPAGVAVCAILSLCALGFIFLKLHTPRARILAPKNGAIVPRYIDVMGTYSNLPADMTIWAYVYVPENSSEAPYFPNHAVAQDGKWLAKGVTIGSTQPSDIGQDFKIGILLADPEDAKLLNAISERGGDLPRTVTKLGEIMVRRE